jgi:hypothetical protein
MRYTLPILALLLLVSACEINQGPKARDAFLGSWQMTDRCLADTQVYVLDIFEDSNFGDDIVLSGEGLYRIGFPIEAVVTGSRLVIPIQDLILSTIPDLRYEFTGTGSINSAGDRLTIDYDVLTLQDGYVIAVDQCIAIGERR